MMKVYHGSHQKFKEFKKTQGSISTILGNEKVEREGFFFTQNKTFAKEFGDISEWRIDIQNTLDLSRGFVNDKVIQHFVDDGWSERFLINLQTENCWELLDGESGQDFKKTIDKLGYDSVKLSELDKNRNMVETIVVFNSKKIKKVNYLKNKI